MVQSRGLCWNEEARALEAKILKTYNETSLSTPNLMQPLEKCWPLRHVQQVRKIHSFQKHIDKLLGYCSVNGLKVLELHFQSIRS